MQTLRLDSIDGGTTLAVAELPTPAPSAGEILVRVHAAGVTPTELQWYPTTHTKDGSMRAGPVLSHEFSGIVEQVGEGVSGFNAGDAVYGMNDWFANGAAAEFCITAPNLIAGKPAKLSHIEAATVPIGALTAWQGLFGKANIQSGERVLVHGGAGAVGMFAVQLARHRGAEVIATASAGTFDFVRTLGATQVIDYAGEPFEAIVKGVDVVFDTVGGATRDRSWGVLRQGGRLVTIAADAEVTGEQRVKDAFLLVEANPGQLKEIARLLDSGALRTFVRAIVPLRDAAIAYQGAVQGQKGYGKTVIEVVA